MSMAMDLDHKSVIGERIAKLRSERGMSAYRLAKNLSITTSAVCCWEKGLNNPSVRNLLRISRLFGVPMSAICDEEK